MSINIAAKNQPSVQSFTHFLGFSGIYNPPRVGLEPVH